jgi:hypothetical protein
MRQAKKKAALAQLVEHPPCKRKVVRSIRTSGTTRKEARQRQTLTGLLHQLCYQAGGRITLSQT